MVCIDDFRVWERELFGGLTGDMRYDITDITFQDITKDI